MHYSTPGRVDCALLIAVSPTSIVRSITVSIVIKTITRMRRSTVMMARALSLVPSLAQYSAIHSDEEAVAVASAVVSAAEASVAVQAVAAVPLEAGKLVIHLTS